MFEVSVGAGLARAITEAYGPERSVAGAPSEWDFWSGPLAAALIAFRDFDAVRFDHVPTVRSLHLVDPVFGPIVFVGVLVEPSVVELAGFSEDPDYWQMIENDPND